MLPLISKSITQTPFQPQTWSETPRSQEENSSIPNLPENPIPQTTNTLTPFSIYLDSNLPNSFRQTIEIPTDLPISENPETASLHIRIGENYPVSEWIYVLVAPFPTVTDNISIQDLRKAWKGKSGGDFSGRPLMMDEATLGVLSAYWGQPAEGAVEVRSSEKLLRAAWDQRPSWAIIPFENLKPQWKVIAIDGNSPIRKDFDPSDYELAIPISMTGVAPELPQVPPSNRDPNKLTVLAMTGVTALVRATAFTMEQQGNIYPATDIGPILQEADITHISNEVPFAADCPYPNPVQEGVQFCSRTKYIELLEFVGTDVIELTGDHFADWGAEAMYYTLGLYDQRGWPYYGGGANFNQGRKPVTIEHNGNKLAFIGCNAKGGGFATANANNPGAVYCDWAWMEE